MNQPTALGATLRVVRKAAGLSRLELADRTGLGTATIQRLETDRHSPTVATLERIAHACDTTGSQVLAEAEKSKNEI